MTRPARTSRGAGGVAKARVFTKCFLALLDAWPWQEIPTVPVEIVLAPPSAPLSVYSFACWARQTVVPLSVVQVLRPVRQAGVDLTEIGARHGESDAVATVRPRFADARSPSPSGGCAIARRRTAAGAASSRRGCGRSSCSPRSAAASTIRAFAAAIEGWSGFLVEDDDRLRPEACQSPIWDTALAILGLRACGVPADHPQLVRAGEWLLAEEVTVTGDWAVRRPDLAPGGWAFEFDNDLYPDVDDAAVVCLALRELGMGEDAVRRGLDWIAGMQSSDGGWGAFDVDNTTHVALQDPVLRLRRDHRPAERGRERARARGARARPRVHERRPPWPPLPAREPAARRLVVGAVGRQPPLRHGAALPALEACGIPHDHPAVRAGRRVARLRPGGQTAASARTSARTTIPPGADAACPRLHKPRGR